MARECINEALQSEKENRQDEVMGVVSDRKFDIWNHWADKSVHDRYITEPTTLLASSRWDNWGGKRTRAIARDIKRKTLYFEIELQCKPECTDNVKWADSLYMNMSDAEELSDDENILPPQNRGSISPSPVCCSPELPCSSPAMATAGGDSTPHGKVVDPVQQNLSLLFAGRTPATPQTGTTAHRSSPAGLDASLNDLLNQDTYFFRALEG